MNVTYEFIKSSHQVFEYELKEGTKTSYTLNHGAYSVFPDKMYLTDYVGKNGSREAIYQIQGLYKKNDSGLYKHINKGKIHTKIIRNRNHPKFLGWGELDARYNIYDLLVIIAPMDKSKFEIHHFRDLARPEYLESVFCYLEKFTKDKSP